MVRSKPRELISDEKLPLSSLLSRVTVHVRVKTVRLQLKEVASSLGPSVIQKLSVGDLHLEKQDKDLAKEKIGELFSNFPSVNIDAVSNDFFKTQKTLSERFQSLEHHYRDSYYHMLDYQKYGVREHERESSALLLAFLLYLVPLYLLSEGFELFDYGHLFGWGIVLLIGVAFLDLVYQLMVIGRIYYDFYQSNDPESGEGYESVLKRLSEFDGGF